MQRRVRARTSATGPRSGRSARDRAVRSSCARAEQEIARAARPLVGGRDASELRRADRAAALSRRTLASSADRGGEFRILRRRREQAGDVERVRLRPRRRAAARAVSILSCSTQQSRRQAIADARARRPADRRGARRDGRAPASRRSASAAPRAGARRRRRAAAASASPIRAQRPRLRRRCPETSTRSCAQRAPSSASGSTSTMRPSSTVTRIAPFAPVSRGCGPADCRDRRSTGSRRTISAAWICPSAQ